MGEPVVHWEIGGKDLEKLKGFYGKLFDWQIDSTAFPDYAMVNTGQEGICGGIMQVTDETPPYVTFYVQVDDLQAYLDKAEGLGGKTVVPPTAIPTIGAFAMFTDPEGHGIGLFKK